MSVNALPMNGTLIYTWIRYYKKMYKKNVQNSN